MLTKRFRRRVERGERGAALVEFALIFPIFMTLALGMFSGGRSYDHNLSVTHAAREGSRYAATLAKLPSGLTPTAWSTAVRDRVAEAAAGAVDVTKPGHFICVALVKFDGSVWTNGGVPYSDTAGTPPTSVPSNCYSDGLTDTFSRVHILVGRPGSIDTVFFKYGLNLRSQATARYELAT